MTSSPAPAPIVPEYPTDLPITERRQELLEVIADNQVVIVAGETGSGKSTQLPKLCLELGRGVDGWIGHTQPRRIAARAVAERVAEELHTTVGDLVGYTVRFTDEVSAGTRVKLMTDGILLAEIQRDRSLLRYDTIIIDEAHERSLNIDFLLGYLKRLLPLRPELKVIVTSATIDTERFSAHFDDAPIVTVEGRAYPVEIRYRPLDESGERADQTTAICDAVVELTAEGPGDILVFQSGEREIRDTADALAELDLRGTEVLPLYARLTAAEQHRVFRPHKGRRVVIATNVAETSLTVPGIRYVVDPGTARVSRFNRRTKVQRLPIEPVSQASANQRAGRCGRVAPGVCIRLFDEEDFASRPEFTDPEVLRTNLASVILQMTALGLGEVEAFPFVEPPESRSIRDGVDLLVELGALDPEPAKTRRRSRRRRTTEGPRLTPVGRRLARLPLDPRLGRMILEAEAQGCVHEVMVIAAALSIQDPREWPAEKRGAAAELHKRFEEPGSDFIAFLRLWDHVRATRRGTSSSQFRRTIKSEYLHFLRIREWQDVYSQLLQTVRRMKIKVRRNQEIDVDAIHRAMLAGLLSNVGRRSDDGRVFEGTRGLRFELARSSTLAKSPPRWVIASEIVETDRPRARVAGRIQPQWIEHAAGHLTTASYGDPYWHRERATAMALEKVALHGLTLVAGREVPYERVDRSVARAMFLDEALVHGDWDERLPFMAHNEAQIETVRTMEARARRRDLLVDDVARFRFFDERVGTDVTTGPAFIRWWKRARERDPELLHMTIDDLVVSDADDIDDDAFPTTWTAGSHELALSYEFDPTSPNDGVTVDVPVTLIDQLEPTVFDWHVPGHRAELITSLLRTLPKAIRRQLVPIADTSVELRSELDPDDGSPAEQLTAALSRRLRLPTSAIVFDEGKLDPHLRVRFRVSDGDRTLAIGDDLAELRGRLGAHVEAAIADVLPSIERHGLTTWDFDELPRTIESVLDGRTVEGFPSLVDAGDSVSIRVASTKSAQRVAMWQGTRRLLRLQTASPINALDRRLTAAQKLALTTTPHGSMRVALEDCTDASIDRLLADHGGPVWNRADFEDLVSIVRESLVDVLEEVVVGLVSIVDANARIEHSLASARAEALQYAARDIERQRDHLLRDRFVTAAGVRRLPDVLRYLLAIERRLDKIRDDPDRDTAIMRTVLQLEAERRALADSLPRGVSAGDVAAVRWMIEELRVSLFAQELGTRHRISETRIRKELDRLRS